MSGKWLPKVLYVLSGMFLVLGLLGLGDRGDDPNTVRSIGSLLPPAISFACFLITAIVAVGLKALLDIRESTLEAHRELRTLRAALPPTIPVETAPPPPPSVMPPLA
jgi:hypothetical protein